MPGVRVVAQPQSLKVTFFPYKGPYWSFCVEWGVLDSPGIPVLSPEIPWTSSLSWSSLHFWEDRNLAS